MCGKGPLVGWIGLVSIGCAGSGGAKAMTSFTVTKPVTMKLDDYRSAGVTVNSVDKTYEDEVQKLASRLVSELQQRRLFESVANLVAHPDAVVDLQLDLTVVQVERVTSSDRFWWGKGSGRASLLSRLRIQEAKSGDLKGDVNITSVTEAENVGSGTTDDTINGTVQEIATLLGSPATAP